MKRAQRRKYHYIYKTTCSLTKRFYIGMHSTDNLDDNYLGSGSELSKSIKKYGKENHSKEILEYLDNRKALKSREKELITEDLRKDPMCMNLAKGGNGSDYALGLVSVRDKNGNTFSCYKDDPRYLSGELVSIARDIIAIKDKDGNTFSCHRNDPRYLSGELVSLTKGTVSVKDRNGKTFRVKTTDQRYINGELVFTCSGMVHVKDRNGKTFRVKTTDQRYINGELIYIGKGRKHSEETKEKIRNADRSGYKNSQYGTCWITNGKESRKIFKGDSFPDDWRLGRTCK